MRAQITNSLVSRLKPKDVKQYDVWDTKLPGFHVRVQQSGRKFYRCYYARGKVKSIGSTEQLTSTEARERAMAVIVAAKDGDSKKYRNKDITLSKFVLGQYGEWRLANRRTAKKDLERIKSLFFPNFGNKKLSDLHPLDIEDWRTARLNNNIKPATVNRDICILKSLLSTAITWDIIEKNPLNKVKQTKVDSISKARFLNKTEEHDLRFAIDERERQLQEQRKTANKWRRDRNYEEQPKEIHNHIKPMVLISINTGVRQGELFGLTWDNIDLQLAMLTITGATAKTGKTRHIPLNNEAVNVLKKWQEFTGTKRGLVFPGKDGKKLTNVTKSWKNLLQAANIHDFRWHDMRHHFASKLVMAGVVLNTVRELLGHSSMKMTLRYAHLAPEHKAQAVAKLLE